MERRFRDYGFPRPDHPAISSMEEQLNSGCSDRGDCDADYTLGELHVVHRGLTSKKIEEIESNLSKKYSAMAQTAADPAPGTKILVTGAGGFIGVSESLVPMKLHTLMWPRARRGRSEARAKQEATALIMFGGTRIFQPYSPRLACSPPR